ncbi:Hint domain-containing protein [Tateyamaria armeniaca]|uniref:Hint domain-containing protein n=1 Tax=Tateyamaria armeniaca TaxID=2518930 RepID=A0ABW8UW64_9RHOB
MTITYYGLDNEFAASTGDNVDTTENSSTFDNPPQGSKDLVITSNADDDDPRVFELGDTYDVSWGGQGGGGSITDAVVVRSDLAPNGEGGIIVFEGVDENGDPAQIIWTPGFDLEGWYSDNYNPSMEPQFYTEDTDPAYTHAYVCFVAGTLIDTDAGAVPVERLRANDRVLTLDDGPQPVIWVGQRDCIGFRADAPITFATGSIGNTLPLAVSAQHRILIRSPQLELHFASHEVLAPAKAFVGLPGVRQTARPTVTYVHVLLRKHHVIRANGAWCESLHLGDASTELLQAVPTFSTALQKEGLQHRVTHTARPVLRTREASHFLARYGAQTCFDAAAKTETMQACA